MYIRHTPIAAMHVTRDAVHNPAGKISSATLILPPLFWSEPELTSEIFGLETARLETKPELAMPFGPSGTTLVAALGIQA
jgi:hypothetical protein